MTSAFTDIIEWVQGLDYWEQAAFDLVIWGKEISEEELDQLVLYLLEENDLNENGVEKPDLKYCTGSKVFGHKGQFCNGDFSLLFRLYTRKLQILPTA
ncbi:hypothetical protein ACFLYP_04210 [Chloroflexota bacterium]